MPVPNHSTGEVVFKIVYAGPEGAGKTTSLAGVHAQLGMACEEAVGVETGIDRTIVFGYQPARPVVVRGLSARFQIMTVPGYVNYAATWQLALRGADGIVFVADSEPTKMESNRSALKAAFVAMRHNRTVLQDVPMVFQYNKRDAADALPVAELDRSLNVLQPKAPAVESIASTGAGLLQSLELLSRQMLDRFGGVEPAAATATVALPPRSEAASPPEPVRAAAGVDGRPLAAAG